MTVSTGVNTQNSYIYIYLISSVFLRICHGKVIIVKCSFVLIKYDQWKPLIIDFNPSHLRKLKGTLTDIKMEPPLMYYTNVTF